MSLDQIVAALYSARYHGLSASLEDGHVRYVRIHTAKRELWHLYPHLDNYIESTTHYEA